jgi:hypothetical protein
MFFSNIYKALFSSTAMLLLFQQLSAQSTYQYSPLYDNLNPVTPTTWQFVKYDELPVSEYTGIPNVTIPLYEIDQDDIKIPLNLTYHAGGIRVNEDASWVGLGWDLQVGSIVQTVNGNDDLAKNTSGAYIYTKLLPDPFNGPLGDFPLRYNYPATTNGPGWTSTVPIGAPQAAVSYAVATDFYIPVNGNFSTQQTNFFTEPQYFDSEPDLFKANFLGYSVNFVMDWSSVNQSLSNDGVTNDYTGFVVLNRKGYIVTLNSDGSFTIAVPNGDEFVFQLKTSIYTNSYTNGIFPSSSSPQSPSAKVWMLTSIITKNKQQITLNYNVTSTYNNFADYSETSYSDQQGPIYQYNGSPGTFIAQGPLPSSSSGLCKSYSTSKESRVYLSSIVFPKGQVTFNTSATQDILGGQKLDSVKITAGQQQIKTYKFNYSYFNSSTTGGNGFDTTGYNFGSTVSLRLKLLSLSDNSGAVHTFTYNLTQLPNKNSFASDYWGFYNGQLSNTSLIPNPSQFPTETALGNNGNNHSANLTYAEAGILQTIQYPTGGTVNFSYELNAFNNYWVPDFSTSTNTVSHGNGLRIHSVTWNQQDGTQSKQEVYTYSTGRAILPLSLFKPFSFNYVSNVNSDNTGLTQFHASTMTEISSSGYYSSSPFSSITGIGYDTVSNQQLNTSGIANGKTVTTYYNLPDQVVDVSSQGGSQLSASLPAVRNTALPGNGSVATVRYFDSNNKLLKKVSNTYSNVVSPLFYGIRTFGYNNYWYYECVQPCAYGSKIRKLVGYYPISDFETLKMATTETDYFGLDSLMYTTTNGYDQYNQIIGTNKTNATNISEATSITYPYDYPSNTTLSTMTAQNRLSDIVTVTKSSYGGSASYLSRNYRQLGGLIVTDNDITSIHYNPIPDTTTYDQYDPSNGNVWQYTRNHLPVSMLWDYNRQYLIAEVKNAQLTNVAYTSFEADGNGRWKFSGTPVADSQAPTGTKAYQLTSGNIYRDSLDVTKTYVVSYWSKNGAQTVSGSSSVKQGYTFNGYTYFEHTVANPSAGTITVSGTAQIDELRLYPNTAQMTSYTYIPLVGMSSESGAGGKISYYEYDSSQRMINMRDQYGNIVKHMSYHYQGQ